MKHTVKALDEWTLDILAVPFGSPEDRDADGEWFDAATTFHEDKFGLPPLVHYHGFGDDKRPASAPEYIGRTVKRWIDDTGVWFRATLDQTVERARELWDAAKQGTVRASSGAPVHLARKDKGHITEWPVVEVSLLDTATGKKPANTYAVALPATKAVYAQAGLTLPDDVEPEARPEAHEAALAARRERAAQLRAQAIDILIQGES